MLATCASDHPFDRGKHIHKVCMAYNNSIHLSTCHTLFFLMFGRQAILPVDTMHGKGEHDKAQSHWRNTWQQHFSKWENGWQLHASTERNSTIRKYTGSHMIKVPWCDYMPNLQLGKDYVSFATTQNSQTTFRVYLQNSKTLRKKIT